MLGGISWVMQKYSVTPSRVEVALQFVAKLFNSLVIFGSWLNNVEPVPEDNGYIQYSFIFNIHADKKLMLSWVAISFVIHCLIKQ